MDEIDKFDRMAVARVEKMMSRFIPPGDAPLMEEPSLIPVLLTVVLYDIITYCRTQGMDFLEVTRQALTDFEADGE